MVERFLPGDMRPVTDRGMAAADEVVDDRGRHGEVWVPADAILTANLSGDIGSNFPGLPPDEGEAPGEIAPWSCWLILLCCCCR